MKLRKTLALLLVFAMTAALFAGCAYAEETPHYTFNLGRRLNGPMNEDANEKLYWEDRLGCTFNVQYFEYANYNEIRNLELASGNIPDVFSVFDRADMMELYDNGFLGGFTEEFLAENAPLLYEHMKANDLLPMASIDGKIYSLAWVHPHYVYPSPVIWNMDWLKAIGFEGLPTTLDEFDEVLHKFATEDPDGNGENDTYGFSNSIMDTFFGSFDVARGLWKVQKDGSLAYDILQEGSKDALTWLAKMYADGVIDPEFITGENHGGYWPLSHAFAEERIGLTGLGYFYHWTTPEAVEVYHQTHVGTPTILPDVNPDLHYDFGNQPVGPNGSFGNPNPEGNGCDDIVFSKEFVEDEERFKAFLDICQITAGLYDIEDYVIAYKGLKGDTWDYDENGNAMPVDDPEKTSLDYMIAQGANGAFRFTCTTEGEEACTPGKYEWINSVYENLNGNYYTNAIFDVLPSQSEYLSEIQTLLDEARVAIITGEKPIDYYDEVVEQAYSMGYDILQAEATEIYNNQ